MSLFKPATKQDIIVRAALIGPPGSGKTRGALQIARALVGEEGRIALIDTENRSASYYSELFKFDTAQMSPPYLVDKYLKAIKAATDEGYNAIVVDSLTHAWAGEGGILQRKEAVDQRPGSNSFTNWGQFTPEQNALVSSVLNSKVHIICTMRSKTEYTLSQNDKGKIAPQKVGLAPIQREGFEYEFDVVMDIDIKHNAMVSKDRTNVMPKEPFKIDSTTGLLLRDWCKGNVVQKEANTGS